VIDHRENRGGRRRSPIRRGLREAADSDTLELDKEDQHVSGPKRRQPTLRSIAMEAGVSAMTVSRALNGQPKVSEANRRRILAIAARQGYVRPNAHARALRTKRSGLVGLLLLDLVNPFYNELARAIDNELREHQHACLMSGCENDLEGGKQILSTLRSAGVDATILAFDLPGAEDAPGAGPLVVIGWEGGPGGPPNADAWIEIDFAHGTREAVRRFIEMGHRRIAHLSSDSQGVRFEAYRAAMKEAGLPPVPWAYGPTPKRRTSQQERAYAFLIEKLRDEADRPTAIITHDDLMALSALQAAQALNLRVPEDIAIFGTDDTLIAQLVTPRLSTLSLPIESVGRLAALLALKALGAPVDGEIARFAGHSGFKHEGGAWRVTPRPVWRESTAPVSTVQSAGALRV